MADVILWLDGVTGNDANDGSTALLAKKTIAAAMNALRAATVGATGNVRLNVYGPCDYRILTPETLNSGHSVPGKISISGYGKDRPYFTGGDKVTGFKTTAIAGVYSATFFGNPRHVFSGASRKLFRSSYGESNDYFRINSWDETNKAVLIATSLVPTSAGIADDIAAGRLEMVIDIGWALSRLRVFSIVDAGGGFSKVFFKYPENELEFAKGNIATPGLGAPFAYGPYHAAGQKFQWENSRDFCNVRGSWHSNGTTLNVGIPVGCLNIAQLEREGIYAGATPTAFVLGGTSMSSPVKNIEFVSVGFKHFDYLPTAGHVGYTGSSMFKIAAGPSIQFDNIPPVVSGSNVKNVLFGDCVFKDIGNEGVKLTGHSGVTFDGNCFSKISANALHLASSALPYSSINYLSPTEISTDTVVKNNVFVDIGTDYGGAMCTLGNVQRAVVEFNTFKRGTDDGVTIGLGGIVSPTWTGDHDIRFNIFDNLMNRTVDGGAVYNNGNSASIKLTAPPTPQNARQRIYGNQFKNIKVSGRDPSGGYAVGIYLDIGTAGCAAWGNSFVDCDSPFQENCALYNYFGHNKVKNAVKVTTILYAGYQSYYVETGLYKLFEPPVSNPASFTDNQKFYGLGDWAGRPFNSVQPFANPAACVNVDGTYNSLSTLEENTEATPFTTLPIGAPPNTLAKFESYLA